MSLANFLLFAAFSMRWIAVDNVSLYVEEAKTLEERAQGLMGRKKNLYMLFTFPYPEEVTFHMRDTPCSLDILFFDVEGRLFNFYKETKTNQGKQLYSSKGKAKWVLEVPSGWLNEHQIERGAQLRLFSHKCPQNEEYHLPPSTLQPELQ
jgi:uncharacterized membrane protein (UPF0127 family)